MRTIVDDELEILCRSCGLCCDGSLFGRVPLDAGEVAGARRRGLRVIARSTAFTQACSALTANGERRGCSIYPERPRACRGFVCVLHERHRVGGGSLAGPLEAVRRARALLARLEVPTTAPERRAIGAELARTMADDFARAR